jgi:hypothetical protein
MSIEGRSLSSPSVAPTGLPSGWTTLPRPSVISRNAEQQDNETNNPADLETLTYFLRSVVQGLGSTTRTVFVQLAKEWKQRNPFQTCDDPVHRMGQQEQEQDQEQENR